MAEIAMSGIWVWRLAMMAFSALVVGSIIIRSEALPGRIGVLLVALALVLSVAALAAAGRPLWQHGTGWRLWAGLALAAFVFAPPLAAMMNARGVPAIHDISTDLENPPQFVAVVAARPDWANSLSRSMPENLADLQRGHYENLASLRLPLPPEGLFPLAETIANRQSGWHLLASEAREGRIEGYAQSRFMGFRDDFVIRIRSDGAGGSVIDMRSVSRVGVSDLGANARRIEAYLGLLARVTGQ